MVPAHYPPQVQFANMGPPELDLTDLPLTANHWGTYRVEVADGKVTRLHDFEADPDPSPIGHGLVDVIDGPTRITRPAVRRSWLEGGPGSNPHLRGKEPFVEISWDEVERLVASEIDRVCNSFGNQAIYGGSYGWASAGRFHHAQSQLHRFLNCAGGYTRSVNSYSFAAAEVMVPHVIGDYRPYVYEGETWPEIIDHAELVVAFGGIPLKNGQINQGGVGRHTQRENVLAAKAAGLSFVNVSPIRSDVLDDVDAEWVAPRPTTDTAIMLALCHTLLVEELHDQAFIDRYTVGAATFKRYVLGEGEDNVAKTPEWAAAIADVDAGWIRRLAHRMASQRTIISVSWSLTRQDHGEQPFWAAIALAALLGEIGLPGRGLSFGLSAVNRVGDKIQRITASALPQGTNPIDTFIPVARISDMLLNPGKQFSYNGSQYSYPDIKLMWWAGGNPFHHHQDLTRMLDAWQVPDTIVVNEWTWNTNAKFADVVLPITTPLERSDLQITPNSGMVSIMERAIEPVGEARNDYEVFSAIAAQLGFEQRFTAGRDSAGWIELLYSETRKHCADRQISLPSLDELKSRKWIEVPAPERPNNEWRNFRNGEPLRTPSGKIEITSEVVGAFGLADCAAHPAWFEPREWLGATDRGHHLHLISNQPVTKLHSQLDHGSISRASKIDGHEPISIHPETATLLGVEASDTVRVHNSRGSLLAGVVIDDGLRPDVVQMATGAWFDPVDTGGQATCNHGNVNVLSHDHGTSNLSQGPAALSCLVSIERYEGPALPVKAFDPPAFVDRNS